MGRARDSVGHIQYAQTGTYNGIALGDQVLDSSDSDYWREHFASHVTAPGELPEINW